MDNMPLWDRLNFSRRTLFEAGYHDGHLYGEVFRQFGKENASMNESAAYEVKASELVYGICQKMGRVSPLWQHPSYIRGMLRRLHDETTGCNVVLVFHGSIYGWNGSFGFLPEFFKKLAVRAIGMANAA